MHLRRASLKDLAFIGSLCLHAYKVNEEGLAYPRCENGDELVAELNLYRVALENAIVIIEGDGGKPFGAFGYLYNPEDVKQGKGMGWDAEANTSTYVIGPFLVPEMYSAANLLRTIKYMEVLGRRCFNELALCIPVNNTLLLDAVRDRGWTPQAENLEMKWCATDEASWPMETTFRVQKVCDRDNTFFQPIAILLSQEFKWKDSPEQRLAEYINEGYTIAFVQQTGKLLGAGIWISVEGTEFGRLEYVVTMPAWRRKKVGAALVRAALDEMRQKKNKEVFLSMDPLNHAALKLYESHHFKRTIQSVVYIRKYGGPK